MTLRLALTQEIQQALKSDPRQTQNHDGLITVSLDKHQVATFKALTNNSQQSEPTLKYRYRNQRVKFGTNAFFFEEGSAKTYEQARYGVFKVANDGEMILVDMADQSFTRLKASLIDKAAINKAKRD